jgi:hypothetical protein
VVILFVDHFAAMGYLKTYRTFYVGGEDNESCWAAMTKQMFYRHAVLVKFVCANTCSCLGIHGEVSLWLGVWMSASCDYVWCAYGEMKYRVSETEGHGQEHRG